MTVQIHGKTYVTVAERLAMVHQASKSFEVVDSSPVQCGNHWVWRVQITLDGKQYIGSAQVHLDARPGSADATDAFACAETSAVGRALAFAGILSSESIASADEMAQMQPQARHSGKSNGTSNSSGEYQTAGSRPSGGHSEPSTSRLNPLIKSKLDVLYQRMAQLQLCTNGTEFVARVAQILERPEIASVRQLNMDDLLIVELDVARRESAA